MATRSFTGNSYFPGPVIYPSHQITVTKDTETSERSDAGNIPQAQLGTPVIAVVGRKRVPDANVIWTGNLRPLTETTTTSEQVKEVDESTGQIVTTTKIVTTTAIVGYLVDVHMGVCLGPGVVLKAVYVDNSPIWTGNIGPARSTFTIAKNDTFLSQAQCVFSGGAFDQAPEPDVDVVDYPGYVGIATILLKGVRADLPMGKISFDVTRIPNPLALSSGNNVSGDDVNVITAIVEVMTNEWGYGGLDIGSVDTGALSTLAVTLKNEGNFASMKIGSNTSIAAVLKSLLAQAGGIAFQHPETGLVTVNLIRAGQMPAFDKRFTVNNIIELRSYLKGWWRDTVDQGRGSYTERDAEYNEVPVFVQNNANPSIEGRGKRTAEFYYPYVPNKTLALSLTARDLSPLSVPRYGYSLLTNRDGASLLPGDLIRVSWPQLSLLNVPMTVTQVRKQDIAQNNVVLTLAQYAFPDITPSFGSGGAGFDPGFDLEPKTPSSVAFITAPYFFARSAFGLSGSQVSPFVYPVILPKPVNNLQFSFSAYVTNVPGAPGDSLKIVDGLYPTYAQLDGAMDQYDSFDDGIVAAVNIDSVVNPAYLVDVGSDGVAAGKLFVIIGNEILSFESVTDNGGGSYTLNNVHRALLDTVFEAHADNATVIIVGNNFNYLANGFSYPPGYTPSWIITSNTLMKRQFKPDGLVSTGWAPANNRTLSPPRPHNTKVNGAARSSTPVAVTEGASTTVTWLTRSRLNQSVASMLDAAEAPETTNGGIQKHRVFHRNGSTDTDLTGLVSGDTATFTMPDVANGAGFFFVQAEIVIAGVTYTSIQRDYIPVTVS